MYTHACAALFWEVSFFAIVFFVGCGEGNDDGGGEEGPKPSAAGYKEGISLRRPPRAYAARVHANGLIGDWHHQHVQFVRCRHFCRRRPSFVTSPLAQPGRCMWWWCKWWCKVPAVARCCSDVVTCKRVCEPVCTPGYRSHADATLTTAPVVPVPQGSDRSTDGDRGGLRRTRACKHMPCHAWARVAASATGERLPLPQGRPQPATEASVSLLRMAAAHTRLIGTTSRESTMYAGHSRGLSQCARSGRLLLCYSPPRGPALQPALDLVQILHWSGHWSGAGGCRTCLLLAACLPMHTHTHTHKTGWVASSRPGTPKKGR